MHVHIVSGIFVADHDFKTRNLQQTMETLLAEGLSQRGVHVTTGGHSLTDRWRADVVHVHHLANACIRLLAPTRTPVVFTRHATKEIPWHHRMVLAGTYRNASAIVALSDVEARGLSQAVSTSKIKRIYNGTDRTYFPLVRRERPRGRWRLLYVGQLIELKRVDVAIRLISALIASGIDAELDIISHRPTLQNDLRLLATELGIADRVRFLGPHTRSELGAAMSEAHVLLLPSRTEALPTVVTEAVFSGLPVVSFDVGGVAEQLPSGVQLPEPNDVDAFERVARKLLEDYEGVVSTFVRHSEFARQRFSVDAMVDAHLKMYKELAR